MVTYPIDWEVIELGTTCEITSSKRVFEAEWTKNGIPFLRTRDISSFHSGSEQKDKLFISEDTYKIKSASSGEPKKGDLLVTGVGTIGLPYLINTDEKMYFKDGNILWLKERGFFNSKFLYLLFLTDDIKGQILDKSGFTTVGTFTIQNAKNLIVPCPSSSEQQAIVSVLSGFDEHIDNLTELIEKKKAIRDGALEDLVSGKTRLDEFEGEWEAIPFNKYFTFLSTNTYSREQLSDSGEIGNIHYGDVLIKYGRVLTKNDYIPRVIDTSKLNAKQYLLKNDVIIADTAEDEIVGKAVQIVDINIPLISGLHTMACRPNYPTADGFLGYYVNSNCYHELILPYVTGIKVSSISKKSISDTELYIPVDVPEQQAIAQILTTMDEEIESLEVEKSKMMQIREGAMDDLLTGRVRLKI